MNNTARFLQLIVKKPGMRCAEYSEELGFTTNGYCPNLGAMGYIYQDNGGGWYVNIRAVRAYFKKKGWYLDDIHYNPPIDEFGRNVCMEVCCTG